MGVLIGRLVMNVCYLNTKPRHHVLHPWPIGVEMFVTYSNVTPSHALVEHFIP